MLIFTSDGWFFDDISNVETVQIIQYAARTIELVRDLGGADLEPEFLRILAEARSNVRMHKNGAFVYETLVRPAMPDVLHPCGRDLRGRVCGRGAETPGALFGRSVAALVDAWAKEPEDAAALERIAAVLTALKGAGLELDLWQSQNVYISTGKALYARGASGSGPFAAPEWARAFKSVGELLRVDPSVFLPSGPV